MTPPTNVKCYLVVAYRWGWTNNSQYHVGCWIDRDTAIAFATAECADRGGKYGVTVYEFDDGLVGGQANKPIHHSPSSYGEKRPYWNRRIELFEMFGNRIVPRLQGEAQEGVSEKDLQKEILDIERHLDIIEAAVDDGAGQIPLDTHSESC